MIKGIYTAASGMMAETWRTDTIANNLANVSTAGFKRDVTVTKDFHDLVVQRISDGQGQPVIGRMGAGVLVDQNYTVQAAGSVRATDNALDLAIEGRGFFAVQTPAGIRYTRNGAFVENRDGELVTQDGYQVLGRNGPVQVQGNSVVVTPEGRVLIDGEERDQIRVVAFADERLMAKEGNSLFTSGGQVERPATGTVRQGFLEMSNVNPVAEMVNLIASYRAYELNAKVVQTHDELLDKAVNEVAKV